MSVQHSPLYHQWTCGVIPIGGRTVIRKKSAETHSVGGIIIPENLQGRHQEDWEAEVVAVSENGGWRMGVLTPKGEEDHPELADRPPEDIPPNLRKNAKIWRIQPYYVPRPEVPPGSRILCCWLSGQPFISNNGYDYFLTDGEHAYKAVIPPAAEPVIETAAPPQLQPSAS